MITTGFGKPSRLAATQPYLLRERHGVDSRTIRRLRANQSLTTEMMDRLCRVLVGTLQDIARYVPDPPEQ